METIVTKKGKIVKVFAETFEKEAKDQIIKLSEYPAYENSVIRIMPDTHAGKGCTIGTTMTITDKVTPNLVGVDIGCGMLTIELAEKDIDCKKLDDVIREFVPNGFNVHTKQNVGFDFSRLICANENGIGIERAKLSLGSLGGGNHFIEVDYSEKEQKYYLVIHSGSRKLGSDVCKYYQDIAVKQNDGKQDLIKQTIESLKAEDRENEIEAELNKVKPTKVDADLAHLSGHPFNDYLNDMKVVQEFAVINRRTIADIIISKMGFTEVCNFETIHNYIDFSRMILRKGAVSAEKGQKLLIPINMRDGSLICIGKGNEDWNYSAPHGAGRLMSRKKAREILSMEEYQKSMDGIYTTSVSKGTIDEAPQAYKPIDEIMSAIVDTADVVDVIKPIYNFKAEDTK